MNAIELNNRRSRQCAAFATMMLCFVLMLSLTFSMSMGLAFATDPTSPIDHAQEATDILVGAGENLADRVYEVGVNWILPFAGLGLMFAAFKMLFGGQKGMDMAWKIALVCICAVALVFMAPLLIKAFGGWFVDASGTMSSVNDLLD